MKRRDHRINIVDTPGHADFGGEVERVLSMVDGVMLLVDSASKARCRRPFVTGKALALGLKPIVVVNKVDRPGARPDWVVDQTFDLFDKLGATDEQLDFPIIYASALRLGLHGPEGCAVARRRPADMVPLFETVLTHVPPRPDRRMRRCRCRSPRSIIRPIPAVSASAACSRHASSPARTWCDERRRSGQQAASTRCWLQGPGARAGGIGRSRRHRHHLRHRRHRHRRHHLRPESPGRLPVIAGGRADADHGLHGQHLAAGRPRRQVRHQPPDPRPPEKELLVNVALRVEDTGDADVFRVSGRGELHLTILLENMRREGFELAVGAARGLQGNRRREMRAV
jgi:GTP-binding protein